MPGDTSIVSIQVAEDGLVYGLSGNSTFFVFDPEEKRVIHSEPLAGAGGVPRHALQDGGDGYLYAVCRDAIFRITPGSFECEKVDDTPAGATAGGACVGGRLYYASGAHVWSYRVPAP